MQAFTVFLLKLGITNYSTPITELLTIVSNFRQRSSLVYATIGNIMHVQLEILILPLKIG